MALNIGNSGNFRAVVKFNARTGEWFFRDGQDETAIEGHPVFVLDLSNICTGWFLFREGTAPSRRIDIDLDSEAPQPTADHKRGFMVLAYSKNLFGGVAEFSSASAYLCAAIRDLHATFEAERAVHAGQVPVIAYVNATPRKTKFGTNYAPTFRIEKWTPRPAELPDESPADPAEVWNGGTVTARPATPRPKRSDFAPTAQAAPVASVNSEF